MTTFQVDSEQVLAANASVQNTIQRLQTEVENLHSQLSSLQNSWRGSASDSFQNLALRWRTTATAVENQLGEIGQALSLAATQYSEIEHSNTRLFLG